MSVFVYTDISYVNRWANDGHGNLVRFFGWAVVVKTQDGRLANISTGVEIMTDESTKTAETRAIQIAHKLYPTGHIISDCKAAIGWDSLADKTDPFHQIAHYAARSVLYTRLVTSGLPLIGRRNGAERDLAHQISNVSAPDPAPSGSGAF